MHLSVNITTFCIKIQNLSIDFIRIQRRTRGSKILRLVMQANSINETESSTKLVTFWGNGGSGKTTAAVFAAQQNNICKVREGKYQLKVRALETLAVGLLKRAMYS